MPTALPSRPAPRLLVLWDLDHTLIETRGLGRALYGRAFPAATGTPLTTLARVSGRTELDIMADSLRLNNITPTNDMITRLAQALSRLITTHGRSSAQRAEHCPARTTHSPAWPTIRPSTNAC